MWLCAANPFAPCPTLLIQAVLLRGSEGVQRFQVLIWREDTNTSQSRGSLFLLTLTSSLFTEVKNTRLSQSKNSFSPKPFWRKDLNAVLDGLMLFPGSWATCNGATLMAASGRKWWWALHLLTGASQTPIWQQALPACQTLMRKEKWSAKLNFFYLFFFFFPEKIPGWQMFIQILLVTENIPGQEEVEEIVTVF